MHKRYRRPIKDLEFSPWRESEIPKTMPSQDHCQVQSIKSIPWVSPWRSRLGTQEATPKILSICVAAPGRRCKSSKRDTKEKIRAIIFQRNQNYYLPLQASDVSHHDFLHLCQYHENLYLDISHGPGRAAKLGAMPS